MTESPLPGRADERVDTPQAQGPSDAELQTFWKQALASAPAAGLAPERLAALRQRILADAAHALAAPGPTLPASPPSAWQRLRRAVQGMLHPQGLQPQWAAGLASVCMACLVLMIWYGRWPEAALEDSRPSRQAPAPDSAAEPARPASQPSAARPPQAPPLPEALPAPAYAPAPPASTAALQSEAAMPAQQAQSDVIAADAIATHSQPHRQRSSFSASQTAAAALAQPLAQATHWRWAGASGQDQAVAIPLSETVRTALQQMLPSAQQPAVPAAAPQQAQRMLLLHEGQVLLQIWVAPGHMQWRPAGADGLIWLAQPSADAYNRLMRALATDASQPKSQ
ncbi:hypothetical protein EBQ34_00015 [Vandammella animalimorsus]|uniref:Uncharacterized protein n=1 Tax=Vandammella animalimorsus TaxID=2029117 RepID=A0A3M6RUB1_9BURK|nr:hypothetical protein [Vandammella animalimorsus]RMX18792.1 hypothetical protein EBQ34_00015 [Vandammella animalimorsus]